MALPQQFMDELRRRTVLSGIVGKRVNLTKKGGRMVGLCPFHSEKTPSFHVRDDEGYYHCFGCGVSGDAITFLREKEGLDFMEAVRLLADMAGMEVPRSGPVDPEAAGKRDERLAAVDDAARYFQSALAREVESGGAVAGYLSQRGIEAGQMEEFRLGYAPRKGLLEALAKAGHSPEVLLETGVSRRSEKDGGVYSYFRHRLMFPIMDGRGRVIAFGARALDEDQQPKYLNSAETPLFQKKSVLYAAHLARPRVRDGLPLLVTEGYMDAIAVHSSGLAASVAPLGTALTEDQIRLLWRIHDQPVLCFDGDPAGRAAALKAVLRALPMLEPGKSMRLMPMPPGNDPDDILRKHGREAFAGMIGETVPLVDVLWDGVAAGYDLADASSRAGFWNEIRQHIRQIGNGQMRASLGDEIESRIGTMRDTVRTATKGGSGGYSGTRGFAGMPVSPRSIRRPKMMPDQRPRLILALLVEHPGLIAENFEQIAKLSFSDGKTEKLRQTVLNAVNSSADLDVEGFRHHLDEYGFGGMRAGVLLEGMEGRLRHDPASIDIDKARELLAEVLKLEARVARGGASLAGARRAAAGDGEAAGDSGRTD